MKSPHIVLIEDDKRLAELIREYLIDRGFKVTHETQGDKAVHRITHLQPDLLILDIMLPKVDGFTICRLVRPNYAGPILMLTAKEDDNSQIEGLETGADDYITKPIDPKVLYARITALLRRHQRVSRFKQGLHYGQLEIDQHARKVILAGKGIDLTDKEYELLVLLASNAGTVLSRDSIMQAMRGIDYDGASRTIDVMIVSLRKKLQDDQKTAKRIKAVWGKGYLLVPDAWE